MTTCDLKKELCGFSCTGMNYSKVWNQLKPLFDEIETIIKSKIDCETCQDDGLINFSGFRDYIKIGIGGEPFDYENFIKFSKRVKCVEDNYKGEPI
jgi:hypothetical protein